MKLKKDWVESETGHWANQYIQSLREDRMLEIFQKLFGLHRLGIVVEFYWVPAPTDRIAKRSLNMEHIMDITFAKAEGKAIASNQKQNIRTLAEKVGWAQQGQNIL